jgi:SHS2 domain-containing protein
MGGWEHFPHGADIGVRGIGATEEEAFEQAAVALTAVLLDPAAVSPRQEVDIFCSAADHELLLVEWLNAVIYEMATRRMVFTRYRVRLDGANLRASALGEAMDAGAHEFTVEVKGATCTELKVAQDRDDGWIAQCVVDV